MLSTSLLRILSGISLAQPCESLLHFAHPSTALLASSVPAQLGSRIFLGQPVLSHPRLVLKTATHFVQPSFFNKVIKESPELTPTSF